MIHEKKISIGAMYASTKKYIDKKDNKEYEADIKDQDIVKILAQAVENEGKYGLQKSILIETRNGKKAMRLNQTTINNLIDAYGKDDAEWIGKEAKVWTFKVPKDGKIQTQAFLSHPKTELSDEGKFLNPENADIKVDAESEEDDGMDWDEIGSEDKEDKK